ncbi:MAG: hypothetical protein ACXW1D_00475 [Halobacteriota archaeon]
MIYLFSFNAIIFTFLSFIWQRSKWADVATKIILSVLAVGNTLALLQMLGYVVKA